ncbi:MAG: hypothetical protein ACLU0O_04650 [Collinsella sp.]
MDVDKFEADSGDKLGTKDTDQFWIVGYDVKDVEMPDAPAVTGFTANAVDSTSVTFSWDDVLANKSGFSYGVGMLQSNAADAVVNSWKIADNTQTSSSGMGCSPIRSIDSPSPPLRTDPRPKQVFARQSSRSRPCPMA